MTASLCRPVHTGFYPRVKVNIRLHLPLPLPILKILTSRLFWITKLHDESWICRNSIKSYVASVCLSIELTNLVHHSTRNSNSHFHITLAQTMHEALPFSSAVGGRASSSRFHCYDWLSGCGWWRWSGGVCFRLSRSRLELCARSRGGAPGNSTAIIPAGAGRTRPDRKPDKRPGVECCCGSTVRV